MKMKSLLALLGLTTPQKEERGAETRRQTRPRRIQPNDRDEEDDYVCWYPVAEPDIDKKANDYIQRVRRKMQMERQN